MVVSLSVIYRREDTSPRTIPSQVHPALAVLDSGVMMGKLQALIKATGPVTGGVMTPMGNGFRNPVGKGLGLM
jgi:hypothetical protein